MIEYHDWPERAVFLANVQDSRPFICRQVAHFDYSNVILSTLASNRNFVDVSCNSTAGDDFCGNPIFREKVNLRMSDFIQAWSHYRRGLHHWILDAGLQLYLSQCCFFCPSDSTTCDLNPKLLKVKCPSVLEHYTINCAQINLWMNIQEARSTLHYDGSDNLLILVHGVKHVTIVSPEYTKYLRPVSACDDNPNHSSMSFQEVEERVNEMAAVEAHNATKAADIFRVVLREGDALYIPEGWWHQVRSEPSSMALNFWFTTSASDANKRDVLRRPYLLRSLIHSMLAEERGMKAKRGGTHVVSSMYNPPLSYPAFESHLLELVATTEDPRRSAPSPPIKVDDSSLTAEGSTSASVCGKRVSARQPRKEPKRTRTAVESRHGDGIIVDSAWADFVQCGVDEQRALWIPFASAHPDEWQRVLLTLSPEACAHLLDYWDTLRPAEEGFTAGPVAHGVIEGLTLGAKELGQDQFTDATAKKEDPDSYTAVKDLDDFFESLFASCREDTTQIRQHLIQQKNVHNEATARRLLGEVLGTKLA